MPDTVTNDDARYAFDIVEAICTEVGPGLPGSAQERERAAFLEKELEAHLGAGNVTVEEFTVAPGACLGSFPISALCVLVAAMLNVSTGHLTGISPRVTATAALAFSIIAASLFVLEFVLSIEVVDPLFGKKRSVNVIGTLRRPGSGAVKRLLMVSGHHDSAPANTWLALLGYGAVIAAATGVLGFITMLGMSSVQWVGSITGDAATIRMGTLGWAMLAYPIVPAVIVGVFFTHGRTGGGIVPGAVDNLAASALAVALSRFLVMHPADIPADTEVRFVSFGSEEAGLRGSRRYVERHRDELRRLDARLLNFETVAHPEIAILTSDVNGTVRNAPEMVTSVVAAAERAGVPYKVKSAVPGVATDAGPFSRAGLKAATLLPFRMPRQLVAFYHQKGDGPAVLTAEPLSNVLKLAVEWIRAGGD
ncbi:MAG TPA: M28 family peptidase [Gemmatimonadaceae bacterium]|nr:M28 family peptidase [Gemmatimonadaceae bacterium]